MVYIGTREGTRSRGRPISRLMDTVRVEIYEFIVMNKRERAGNREDWKRALKEVKAGIML